MSGGATLWEDGRRHIVALSGGKDSTALALRLAEVEPRAYQFVCTPTGDELPEMDAHWRRLEVLLGQPIIRLVAHGGLNNLIQLQGALPNWRQRWCTRMLKIEPFRAFLVKCAPAVSYVGLRADEPGRAGGTYDEAALGIEIRYPMREWGWGIGDVRRYLAERGVCIPKRSDCARCFFQRLIEWYELWRDYPHFYADAERQEIAIGHTFRSPGRDTWPASLRELREQFEAGRIPKPRRESLKEAQCRVCSL